VAAADLVPIEILDHLLALAINGLGVAVIILAMAVVMAPDPRPEFLRRSLPIEPPDHVHKPRQFEKRVVSLSWPC